MKKATSSGRYPWTEEEVEVTESWREALRLLVADCKDDDVDDVLLSILNPLAGELKSTARARAVLATLCLADEPNVAEPTAEKALRCFSSVVGKGDATGTSSSTVDKAAIELASTMWWSKLRRFLVDEYCRRDPSARADPGALCGIAEVSNWSRLRLTPETAFADALKRLDSNDRAESISGATAVMAAAFMRKAAIIEGLIASLLAMLPKGGAATHAAAWALVWLNGG